MSFLFPSSGESTRPSDRYHSGRGSPLTPTKCLYINVFSSLYIDSFPSLFGYEIGDGLLSDSYT